MLNWFKNVFGITPKREEPLVLTQEVRVEETVKPKTTKKAAPKKKEAAVDLSSMKKDELLAHAKKVGAKANASMKKEDIITAIASAS